MSETQILGSAEAGVNVASGGHQQMIAQVPILARPAFILCFLLAPVGTFLNLLQKYILFDLLCSSEPITLV